MIEQKSTSESGLEEDHIFLLLPGFSLLCLANAVEPLRAANTLSDRAYYRRRLVSLDGDPVISSSGIRADVDLALADAGACDAFFIVSSYDYDRWSTPAFNARLRAAMGKATMLGGLDTGAWLLAAAGLLEGRRATIHWQELDRFQETFVNIGASADRYVIDGNRITAGGATTVLDLMLRLIRARHGDALAIEVMRLFLYDTEHSAERPQRGPLAAPFIAEHPLVSRAISLMEEAVEDPLTLPQVAVRAGCSQRQLERGFSAALGRSPGTYYRGLRLAAARRYLRETGLSMAEIAARTGFNSAAAFSRAFRREYGFPPSRRRRPRF